MTPSAPWTPATRDDYVLGTDDDEIARLGLQHRVWRPRMLDAFARAGITAGSRVVDVGAGPGVLREFDAAERDPSTITITPLVLELIAERI